MSSGLFALKYTKIFVLIRLEWLNISQITWHDLLFLIIYCTGINARNRLFLNMEIEKTKKKNAKKREKWIYENFSQHSKKGRSSFNP